MFLAALGLPVGGGLAAAQTVIVMNAPASSPVELVVNRAPVARATTDTLGDATLTAPADAWPTATGAAVYVDACPAIRRILILDRSLTPTAPEALCDRRQVSGVFWVQRISTLVIDVGRSDPTLRLRQGSPPAGWLSRDPLALSPQTGASLPGLVLFGGGGFGTFRELNDIACGGVDSCSGGSFRRGFNVGVTYWLTPFLGVEASVLRPRKVAATGDGGTFNFDSSLETDLVTVAGTVGIPTGRVRLYGQAGAHRHRTTLGTTQTTDWVIFNAEGAVESLGSDTQTFDVRTAGWGFFFGGGIETWVARSLAIYVGAHRIGLKGVDVDAGEGQFDDRLLSLVIGARVRIGG